MKQETNEEKTKEQLLQEEATEYYNLAKEYRRDRYIKDESEVVFFKNRPTFLINFGLKNGKTMSIMHM
jgi:hypothetical protein